jgi:hypothetical protein
VVGFSVPESLRTHAPSEYCVLCVTCLRTAAASAAGVEESACAEPEGADFSAVDDTFPGGRAGVAFSLAVGKLGSLALERSAIEDLCETAEREGTDVWLALDRLSRADGLDPHFDVSRRTEQLSSFR